MASAEAPRDRHQRLLDAIELARQRLAYRRELKYAETGTFLQEMSRELHELGYPDGDEDRESDYDRIEERLQRTLAELDLDTSGRTG